MSKIPPRDWPVYNAERECTACGSTETEDVYQAGVGSSRSERILRTCVVCRSPRFERPLDFDFAKWKPIWDLELVNFRQKQIEGLQRLLVEARKALDG